MSKFFDDTMQGLLEAIEIEKGNIPLKERENMPAKTFYADDLETCLTDSRLTEPSDGKRFRWREMIEEVKRLGRPLTETESEQYLIK